MSVFCRLFGHTWWPVTRAPEPRWNTTKEGHTLVATVGEDGVRHVRVCKRCGREEPEPPRRHDADRAGEAPPGPETEPASRS